MAFEIRKSQGSISIICLLLLFLFLSACLSVSNKRTAIENHPGQKVYATFCATCHGVKMEAFVNYEWQYGFNEPNIKTSIIEGRGDGAMPAFKEALTVKQVDDLVDYLQKGFQNLAKYDFKRATIDSSTIYESKDQRFRVVKVADGLKYPWGMASLNDQDLLVTEKSGELYLIQKGKKKIAIQNVPQVKNRGQGGLMDVVLHPDYEQNGWIYLSYTKEQDGLMTTAVSRFQLKGTSLEKEKLIFEGLPYSNKRYHFGSRLAFDRDQLLYITMGDRGSRDVNPQRLDLHPGKVHRLQDDGTIPKDNPFYDEENALKSIFSFGHRNPQGLAMHPFTGELWAHEHGPRGGDELNRLKKGANYGWPILSYGINYDGSTFTNRTTDPEMEDPVYYWVPSIAPSGMAFVSSEKYTGWQGHLLIGSLKFQNFSLCKLKNNEVVAEEILMKGIGRVRNIVEGADGTIYLAVEDPGVIYKILPVD